MRTLLALVLLLGATALCQDKPKTHELCKACHSEQVSDFLTHPHAEKLLSCDACHGTSVKHREAAGGAPPDRVAGPQEVPALCGGCHAAVKPQFDMSKHAKVLAEATKVRAPNCGTCHGVHARITGVQMETRCNRCHTQIPAVCKTEAAAGATFQGPRCMQCHDRHTLAKR